MCEEHECVESMSVWRARVCGERECVESVSVWRARVCGERECVKSASGALPLPPPAPLPLTSSPLHTHTYSHTHAHAHAHAHARTHKPECPPSPHLNAAPEVWRPATPAQRLKCRRGDEALEGSDLCEFGDSGWGVGGGGRSCWYWCALPVGGILICVVVAAAAAVQECETRVSEH